jgi:hypothetical protein
MVRMGQRYKLFVVRMLEADGVVEDAGESSAHIHLWREVVPVD